MLCIVQNTINSIQWKKNILLSSLVLEDKASSNGLTEQFASNIINLPETEYILKNQTKIL